MERGPYVKSDSETLSIRDAKKIAGVSRKTIYSWMKSGNFDYERRYNNQVAIVKVSFLKYLEELKKQRSI